MWISPAGTQNIPFNHNDLPSRELLEELKWVELSIGVAPERVVIVRGGLQAKRLQYSLKHIGAITINKSQGETLPLGIAIEITEQYSPWEKGQIVVLLSRTTTSLNTILVGEKNCAIQKMWDLITTGTQWTVYTQKVLDVITISSDNPSRNDTTLDFPEIYPFRLNDGNILPTDNTGFVYCLISVRHKEKIYIGQTQCLSQRLIQHNSGHGSNSTQDIRYRPWAIAGYICGLSHMLKIDRERLERNWKIKVQNLIARGTNDSYSWILSGQGLVESYNNGNTKNQIHYIKLVSN